MLSYPIKVKDEWSGKLAYEMNQPCEEANMLTATGADTTSAAIAAILFYLIHDPVAREQLTTEIRTTLTSLYDIKSGKQLQCCLYLWASILGGSTYKPAWWLQIVSLSLAWRNSCQRRAPPFPFHRRR